MRFWNFELRDTLDKWGPAVIDFGAGFEIDNAIVVGINKHAFQKFSFTPIGFTG